MEVLPWLNDIPICECLERQWSAALIITSSIKTINIHRENQREKKGNTPFYKNHKYHKYKLLLWVQCMGLVYLLTKTCHLQIDHLTYNRVWCLYGRKEQELQLLKCSEMGYKLIYVFCSDMSRSLPPKVIKISFFQLFVWQNLGLQLCWWLSNTYE